jgi:hypothetical protein
MPEEYLSEEELYAQLPTDPAQAFLYLESHYRKECEARVDAAHEERTDVFYVRYMSKVIAAIESLGLQAEFTGKGVPQIGEVDYDTYLNFGKDVEHYMTKLRIVQARRSQGFSVRLDATTKDKLRHYLQEIRTVVDALEVDERKKAALYDRINDLQREIDQDRAPFDRYASLSIAIAGVIGEAIEKSHIRHLLNSVERVLWGAQTETQQLSPPPTPRRIEGPKPAPRPAAKPERKPPMTKRDDMDDEIPF